MTMQIFKDNRVHVSTIGDNGIILVAQDTNVQMGTPVYNTKFAFVRRTYPAIYNHVVRNMNTLIKQTKEKKKRSMRGGHFFLYRYMVLLAFLLCLGFGIASVHVKACASVSFILSILHIFLSIYNIVIYRLNHPILHPYLAIPLTPEEMPRSGWKNLFYKIPFHTNVRTGALGALIDPTRIVAAVQFENTHVDEIQIMLYTNTYKADAKFPKECAFYLILFIIMFILSIIFVGTTVS